MKRTQLRELTAQKKQAFLDNYPKFYTIAETAASIGVSPVTVWRWQEADNVFSKQCNDIKKEAEELLLKKHEKNIDEIAFDPSTPPQTRILASFFKCKRYDPQYRDRVPDTRLIGDITVKLAMPSYREPILIEGGKNAIQRHGEAEGSYKEGGSEAQGIT